MEIKVNSTGNEPTAETYAQDVAPQESWLVRRGLLLEAGPRRILATGSFINMIGGGMWMTAAALFYTRSVGLSVAQVGLGMGIGAVIGLLAGIPVGKLADRRGPREVYLLTLVAQALGMAAMVLVHSFWLFVTVICLTELASSASKSSRAPLVRGFSGKDPVRFRAYMRSAVNLAGALGATVTALMVEVDTRAAYDFLVLANAVSFLLAGVVVLRLPSLPPVKPPAKVQGPRNALRDYPFLVFTLLDGLMSFNGKVLSFALPLWIVIHTHAPHWLVGATVVINTGMVVVFQVKASKNVDSPPAAARFWRRSGWSFLAGMILISLTSGMPGWLAALVILVGCVVFTIGELWQAAGAFELRYSLAPAHAQGQYTGVSLFGSSLSGVAAPSILGYLCVTWGAPGWWVTGAMLVAVGLAVPPVVQWSQRLRPATVD
ncbi:MFS transporter [Streptomyces fuscichromogenes]|uniref:MFS transporter n=1 Tax=Streptomyces fuscichromogenes TaxID=1324013 RepID=UPI0037F792F3